MSILYEDGTAAVDFRLPPVRLNKNHVEKSSTHVPWLKALSGKVIFEPWEDFDKLFDYLRGALHWIPEDRWKLAIHHLKSVALVINPGEVPGDDEGVPKPVYSTESSMSSIFGNVYNAVGAVIQEVEHTRKVSIKSKSIWLGRPADVPKGMPEEEKDAASSETIEGQEAKAQKKSSSRKKSKKGKNECGAEESQKEKQAHRAPDFTLMDLKSLSDGVGTPVVAYEVKGALMDILGTPVEIKAKGKSRLPKRPVSAEDLCARFNYLFEGEEPNRDEESTESEEEDEGEEKDVVKPQGPEPNICAIKPVCQALTYALSVASGCVLLDNYHVSVAMEILKREDTNKIHVRVSRGIFRKDAWEGKGPVEAKVALGLHGLKRANQDLAMYLQNLAERISKEAQDLKDKKEDGNREAKGKREYGNSEAKGNKRSSNSGGRGLEKRRKTGGDENQDDDGRESLPSQTDAGMSSSDESSGRKGFLDGSGRSAGTNLDHKKDCAERIQTGAIQIGRLQNLCVESLLGSGSSGDVFRSSWNGKPVAVKKWNGLNEDGMMDLDREVAVYQEITKECPSLLGVAIPDLIYTQSRSEEKGAVKEALLVTEIVGYDLTRNRRGQLFIVGEEGKTAVSADEERQICDKALESLQQLHSNGFIHGDIALRNVRVDKSVTGNGNVRWKVWWLDLGQCEKVPKSLADANFRMERRMCTSTFGTRKK